MRKISLILCLSALFGFQAAAVQATPLTYAYDGPKFNQFTNNVIFNTNDHIWGSVTFDSALLSSTGNGGILSNSFGASQFTTWIFEDGYNNFNNVVTTTNFEISMNFVNFMPTNWNIDTTFGHTFGADIFVNGSPNNYLSISYYQGSRAYAWNNVGQPWSQVPEPGTLSLLIGGLGLMGFAARRRKQNS